MQRTRGRRSLTSQRPMLCMPIVRASNGAPDHEYDRQNDPVPLDIGRNQRMRETRPATVLDRRYDAHMHATQSPHGSTRYGMWLDHAARSPDSNPSTKSHAIPLFSNRKIAPPMSPRKTSRSPSPSRSASVGLA